MWYNEESQITFRMHCFFVILKFNILHLVAPNWQKKGVLATLCKVSALKYIRNVYLHLKLKILKILSCLFYVFDSQLGPSHFIYFFIGLKKDKSWNPKWCRKTAALDLRGHQLSAFRSTNYLGAYVWRKLIKFVDQIFAFQWNENDHIRNFLQQTQLFRSILRWRVTVCLSPHKCHMQWD